MNSFVPAVVLENPWVRLVPLSLEHVPDLAQLYEPDTWQFFVTFQPSGPGEEGMRGFVQALLDCPTVQAWVVIDKSDGRVVGCTTFLDIRPAHKSVEIGMTWYHSSVRGTKVNPACKLALLEFGFEELGCVRIQLKTDGRNLHSQAAIRKLGAKEEGTLRKHGIMPDGFIRDTVFFSILPEEWPDVRANLLARLG